MKLYYLLPFLLFVSGCTTLGTKATIYQPHFTKNIKTIGILIVPSTFPDHRISNAGDSSFIQALITETELQTKCHVISIGTIPSTLLDSSAQQRFGNVDAVLACEAHISQMVTHDRSKRFTSRVHTRLYEVYPLSEIASTYFDTKIGKSYLHYPPLTIAIQDGVVGVLQPLHKIFKTLGGSQNSLAIKHTPIQ